MSKKTLLNEATVRCFMKLANTQPLADNFVNEMGGYAAKAHEDEEEAPEDMGPMDEPMGDEPMGDEPMDEPMADEPMADEPMDEPMGDDADEVEISEDDRAVLGAAAAILMKIAGEDDGAGGMDIDMGDDAGGRDMMEDTLEEEAVEEGMYAKKDDEDAVEEGTHAKKDDDEVMEEKVEELEEAETPDKDDLVQEVTRRVAEKLRAAIKSRE